MSNPQKPRLPVPVLLYFILLIGFTIYVLLDAFIIPRSYIAIANVDETTKESTAGSTEESSVSEDTVALSTDTTYQDDQISITLNNYRAYDTDIYVADIILTDASVLKTALANDIYGKNITATTSSIAEAHQAILAINGDFYSARNGYCIRNGILYRNTSDDSSQQDLVIYQNGDVSIISEGTIRAEELLSDGAQQVLSFGPALIEDGDISVSETDEVSKAKTSNPRTAFCMIDTLHYAMVVSDGRTDENAGLSLFQLASFINDTLAPQSAYNLDGGGSSTMYFNDAVVNQPTTTGNKISERKVSDIVYIGYN